MRIERLWVDVTAQVGAFWAGIFTTLELRHGLNINDIHHIWLLHHLFLPLINQQLTFFAESWNQHRIQIRDGPNRSPTDMFGFDMLVHGIRGDQLPEDDLTEEELEVYGVDWDGLHDEQLLNSQRANNLLSEGSDSWVGRVGPPDHLNEVSVNPPVESLLPYEVDALDQSLWQWMHSPDDADIITIWTHALVCARAMRNEFF